MKQIKFIQPQCEMVIVGVSIDSGLAGGAPRSQRSWMRRILTMKHSRRFRWMSTALPYC